MNKKFLLTIFIFLSFITKSISSEFIGVIGVAVGDINNQKNEKLINGSKVFFGDTIFVKSKSNAQILFLDETVMTVGENTELTIDDFVYDPKTDDGNFVTNIKYIKNDSMYLNYMDNFYDVSFPFIIQDDTLILYPVKGPMDEIIFSRDCP